MTATTFGSNTFICINAEKQSINMKKILYSVFMLATMVLAACSSEDTIEPVVKRGMVLKANVEAPTPVPQSPTPRANGSSPLLRMTR